MHFMIVVLTFVPLVFGHVVQFQKAKSSNELVGSTYQKVDHATTLKTPFFVTMAKDAFQEFKSKFGKVYSSVAEEEHRLGVFMRNFLLIMHHNYLHSVGRKSYTLAVNHLADLSRNEIVRTMNGFRRQYNETYASNSHLFSLTGVEDVTLPKKVDWRESGAVTPVKNQKQCGSCWSFSATGSLEGQHFLRDGKLVSLSEQNLMDCSRKLGNNGCEGGLMDNAFRYVKQNHGIDTERSYPYEARDAKCRFDPSNVGATDVGYQDIPSEDEQALKKAVAKIGPISVAIDASGSDFHFYEQGVYDNVECSETQLDHGVLAVGYGTDEQSGKDYWIVKNSWGPSWGKSGYIWMARNKDNQCGIATQASYPLVNKDQ